MSAPIRFLGLAIIAYVGLRTASSALALEPMIPLSPQPKDAISGDDVAAAETLPPGVPADMGPLPGAYQQPPAGAYPYAAAAYGAGTYPYMAAGAPMPCPMLMASAAPRASRPIYYPVPYPVPAAQGYAPAAAPAALAGAASGYTEAAAIGYASPIAPIDQWPVMGASGPTALGEMQTTPGWGKKRRGKDAPLAAARPDRWSVDAWALLRPREGTYRLDGSDGTLNPGLASAGSLGGSQAGMRISWRPLSSIGVHLRASSALLPQGSSARNQTLAGGEGAVGISWQPLRSLPVRVLAERRQRLGSALGGGRKAFALLAEGGIYQQPLAYGISLDGYAQAGVVGASSRDLFADGALAATYPFMPRFAIGAGLWGGIQPGLSRFDAGPRLSYQLRPNLRAHLDYRFKVTGNADPRSGPALTLAAGF